MIPPPENFIYNGPTQILSWESILGADGYWIEWAVAGTANWYKAYNGPDTSCGFDHPTGQYQVKGKSQLGNDYSQFGKPKIITI